jgi:hypothetical protein
MKILRKVRLIQTNEPPEQIRDPSCTQYNNLTMEREQVEGIDVIVLERPGELRTEVDLAELPHPLSNPKSLIWCDVTGTEGGQQGPYGRCLLIEVRLEVRLFPASLSYA